jgi:hypothetical protein
MEKVAAPIIGALISALATVIAALIASRFITKSETLPPHYKEKTLNYRERMEKLSAALANASSEVDKVLEEIAMVSRAREENLKNLESKLNDLAEHEKELNTRVETLRNVPIPAIEYFLEATKKGEKRSAFRDYILFGLGIISTSRNRVDVKAPTKGIIRKLTTFGGSHEQAHT